MNLVDQLREILANESILPDDPNSAKSGTDLLEIVRPLLNGTYSDNSLRQTFSVLSADPTSPIARAERGYGYYRRPTNQRASIADSVQASPEAKTQEAELGRENQREEKFRAFYLRRLRLDNLFPVRIDHVTALRQQAGVNKWKFPDAVVLTWDVGESSETGFALDQAALEVRRGLGEQPFRLTSVELKVDLSLTTFREYFFQCVSNSMWAHSSLLAIACPVLDALLANELRRLGTSYGVGISAFDFTREQLDELPPASKIVSMPDSDFEALAAKQRETTITSGALRSQLDWEHIKDLKVQSYEFSDMFAWIARCLKDGKAYTIENYLSLRNIEAASG
ncbi:MULTISPECIES: hypothetical protein [Bradyrhizobium]|uniref:Uncharacterized protein n=1 Tax=Bradyrhizobium diazoefficiens TaxID=1355477 RepID=A0A810BUT8_9BRAD|nr:hypothetical protein [Bradyrhizobium diazoefficiens]MBP1060750.1 hypothetical protein [Bradyrhizobium japonicum]QJS40786.1 hypothetical protein DI395_45260 [Bradyrhizobium diazoefficiens]BBZ90756.1 hypothetical protein F07S3_05890 [Bradyrhizobium diazoefficiens]BCA08742.1 hypothetical protein BDHF08_05890 [Bradyrhizobium diazoefficiens]BCE53078.1 hypothetical protein XF5B_05900 [Bradyrhizobium diazoefficiens]